MPTLQQVIRLLPGANNQYDLLVKKQNVYDIVDGTLSMHKKSANSYDLISQLFWKGNTQDTCKEIFNFCKQYIPYKVEPEKVQTGKTLEMILWDAQHGKKNDCKHYSLLGCGIIESLKRKGYPIESKYRFASDIKGVNNPTHVFCIVPTYKGDIWLDPVLNRLHQYHKYYYFLDKTPPKMAYYHVSGTSNVAPAYVSGTVSTFGASIGKHGKGKAKLKKFTKKIQPGKFLLKVVGAAPRNAFLALLKINFNQFSRHIFELSQNPSHKSKFQSLWRKLGGKWNVFAHNVNLGYQHYLKQHHKKMPSSYHLINGVGEDGSVGFVLATAMAAALPIITAITALLKSLGRSPEGGVDTATGAEMLVTEHNTTDGQHADGTETEVEENNTLVVKSYKGNKHEKENVPDNTDIDTTQTAHQKTNTQGSSNDDIPENVEQSIAIKKAEKKADSELPDDDSPAAKTVNVLSDWGKGVGDFVRENKGVTIAVVSISSIVLIARSGIFPHHKTTRR